jgi:cytochrome oxidase Cu insertion factor (SCO1/SenC/PrrC family)
MTPTLHRMRLPLFGGLVALIVAVALLFVSRQGQAAAEHGSQVWGASYFPNVVLTDQDGQQHRFFDDLIKDKVVSINFIFTSCAASCGLETARLKEIQTLLAGRVGQDVHFYSISIDPLNDTPAELKKYAAKFGAGPGWKFLTGRPADIELIQRKLGLFDDADKGKPITEHSLEGIIGNQGTGRWQKTGPFQSPYVTAVQLGEWLHNYKVSSRSAEVDYANAPTRLRNPTRGETLFRTRCMSCHDIGSPEAGRLAATVGPNLQGVLTRHNRTWLTRWIKEPDRMLAEKDPEAMALLAQFKQVPMPNFNLSRDEVEQVLGFIAEENARVAQATASAGKSH